MKMQICSTCNQNKPFSEFYRNKTKRKGINTCCKQCDKIRLEEARQYAYRVLDRYKVMKGCARCGYKEHPAALEFNHINPELKKFCLAERCAAMKGAVFKEEFYKCEVLCANCHNIHTYGKEEAYAT